MKIHIRVERRRRRGLKEGEGEGHNLAQGGREREGGEGGEGLKEEMVYRYRVLEYLKLRCTMSTGHELLFLNLNHFC